MAGEIARRGKSSITPFKLALVGLLSCVFAFMPRKIAQLGKSSIPPFKLALLGLLSCMDAAVNDKLAWAITLRFASRKVFFERIQRCTREDRGVYRRGNSGAQERIKRSTGEDTEGHRRGYRGLNLGRLEVPITHSPTHAPCQIVGLS